MFERHRLRKFSIGPVVGLAAVLWTAASCSLFLPPQSALAQSQPAAGYTKLTLAQSLEIAFEKSPRLRAERARLAEARGRLVGARTYPFNPELGIEAASRRGRSGANDTTDRGINLSQEIEIAGQRGRRIDVARGELTAANSRLLRAKRMLAAKVHLAFLSALESEALLQVARAESELAGDLLDLTEKRLSRGAATQLDVNVAAADFGRATQALGEARAASAVGRASLAEVLGLDPSQLPHADGHLNAAMPPPRPLEELLARAQSNRADLEELRQLELAAQERIRLARSKAWPNVRLGLFAAKEERTDTLVGGGLTVPVPLFQRNQGGIATARASARLAQADRDAARLSVVREVVAAYEHYQAAAAALASLRKRVLGTSRENLKLMNRAYLAGKLSWVEVLVMRQTLFDARRVFIRTGTELRQARITIDIASGEMPLPARAMTESAR